jgi:helix-turn-helix protein
MRAKIDMTEVETRTKIRAKYLRAIENEEWDLLPGEIYVKSFLRTYGDYLGLDSRMLVDEFKRRYDRPSDNELRPLTPSRARERRRGPPPPWAVIGAVLVLVLVVLFFVGNSTKSKSPTTPTTKTGATHRRGRRRHHAAVTGAPRASAVRLQLIPTGQVYVCLVDGGGRKLIPGRIFSAGQTIPTHSASKLLLTLGNNSVKMRVNGALVNITNSPSSIGFLLKPGSTTPLPVSKQPRCA